MAERRTIEVSIPLKEDLHEFLIAELVERDFEAFQQDDHVLKAYVPASRWNDVTRQWLEEWLVGNGLEPEMVERDYEPTNWNQKWEETVQPIAVSHFLIKPTWSEIPEEHRDKLLLEVDPKMSFGTGYHESTRLMLRLMSHVDFTETRVLDAGTGTGILAVAAAKSGARYVLAFDIDEWSYQNCLENSYLNDVADRIEVKMGGMEAVPAEQKYDVILANIQLNVLVDSLPVFQRHLAENGRLILSGLMLHDRPKMEAALRSHGFHIERDLVEGDWWAVTTYIRSA